MTGPRKRLGEILVDAGVLDAHQLQAALGHQRQWGGKLGRILVEKRFITEEIMLRAVSRQLGLDMVDLSQQKVHERVIGLLTPEIVTKFNVIPVGLKREGSAEVMYLAMSDPTNVEATDTVSFKTGKKVRPLLASEASIERAIRLYYLGETAIPNVQPVVEAQFGGHEVELTEDLPVLTGTAATQAVALAPPPPPAMPPPAPFSPPAAPPAPPAGGDWFLGDSNPPAPPPQAPPRAAAPTPALATAPFGPANGMLGDAEHTPPPVAPTPANTSGVWATPGPPVVSPPAYAPPPPAEPVHTPAYGVTLPSAPAWNPPAPLAPPPPPTVVTSAGFPLPGPGFPFPPAPPVATAFPPAPVPPPPPATPAVALPATPAMPAPAAADDWGAAVDDPNPPQPLPPPAAAPRTMDALELPPDDGAPMQLADAHEFLDAAQANHGGNAWVKSVPTTRGTTGEIEFDEGAAMDLELAFEPMDMVAPAQPAPPQAPLPQPPAADPIPTAQAPVEPAWGAPVAWSAPVEPAAQPPAAPQVAAAPLPEVQAGLPTAEPSWGDALGGLPAPPHTPHAWAAPAQQAAASSGWPDAAPAVDALPESPAGAPPPPQPPTPDPQPLAESPTLPPALSFSVEEQAALDIPPAPPPPVAPQQAAALDVGAAPDMPPASVALPAGLPAAPTPDADGRVDLLGAPRMLTNQFATLSQSLDPSLERSGRFPAVSLADQSSPPAPLPSSVMEAAAASAAAASEMPSWDLALGLPDSPPPAVPPVAAVPSAAGGGFLFGAGEVVTDPVALRLEPEGGNVALGMPTTLPGAEAPPPATMAPVPAPSPLEQAWGAPAESTIATDPAAAVASPQAVDADAAWGALTQGEDVAAPPAAPSAPPAADADAGLAWEAADLLEGLPPPQGDVLPPVETPLPQAQPAVSVLPPLEPAAAAPMAPAPPAPTEDALANTNLEAASVVSLARLFIKKGLLSEDEVKEALSKPPQPRDKG